MIFTIVSGMLALQSAPAGGVGQARGLRPRTPPDSWISDADYPSNSLMDREFGIVGFRLDIDREGNAFACHILASSGFWRLDEQACSLLRRRARFEPARGADGNPIPATFQSRFSWILPGTKQNYVRLIEEVSPVFDLVVSLNKLPKAYKQPALVRARFGTEAVVECSVELSSGSEPLDQVACQQATKDVARPPFREGLLAQPNTRMVSVSFTLEDKAE